MSNDKLFLYDKIDYSCRGTKMLLRGMLENNVFYELELLRGLLLLHRTFLLLLFSHFSMSSCLLK